MADTAAAAAAGEEGKHATFMRRAIELSERAGIVEKTGGCFGAIVVDSTSGEVVGEGFNKVVANNDPTWHGEMEAIREACKKRGAPHLRGCVIYTSAQPCPMCYATCMWARVDLVYYGATYEDVMEHGKFEDADFLGELRKPEGEREIKCEPLSALREEAVDVWRRYAKQTDNTSVLSPSSASLCPGSRRLDGARLTAAAPSCPTVGRRRSLAVRAATYSVTFKGPDGEEKTIEVADDEYILDAAENAGMELPYACHGGTCSSCACRVLSGTLDQSEQSYLDEGEQDAGFALICSSYPTSDLVLLTHQQAALEDFALEELQGKK